MYVFPNIWSLIDSVLSMALRVDLDNWLVGFCSPWCFDDLNPVSQGGAHRLIGFARKKAMNNHWNTVHHGDLKNRINKSYTFSTWGVTYHNETFLLGMAAAEIGDSSDTLWWLWWQKLVRKTPGVLAGEWSNRLKETWKRHEKDMSCSHVC